LMSVKKKISGARNHSFCHPPGRIPHSRSLPQCALIHVVRN
jgi:hypothetical protein